MFELDADYLERRTKTIANHSQAKKCCGIQGNLGFEKGSKAGDDEVTLVCKVCKVHHYSMKARPMNMVYPVTRAQTAPYPAPSSVPFNPCFVADVGM